MNHVLLCATDAGGLRNLVPLLDVLAARKLKISLVARASMKHLLPPYLPAHRFFPAEEVEGRVSQVFASTKPDVVICGTTRHPSPDRDFLSCARQSGVRSVAVLDEWYNYRYRFCFGDEIQQVNFPDIIALPDKQAVREAVAEGLPPDRCHATGSPSLARLWALGDSWKKCPPPVSADIKGASGVPIITFISETHAEDYGGAPGDSGLMGAYIGYTELTVRDSILEVLSQLDSPVILIEKRHPAAKDVASPSHLAANVDYRQAARDIKTWELCFHSNLVIGMRSMALLESYLLGCTAASYQPGLIDSERCAAVRLGLIPGFRKPDELLDWIKGVIEMPVSRQPLVRPWFADEGSAARIIDLSMDGVRA